MTHIAVIILTGVITYVAITYLERRFHVAYEVARDLNAK